jgi:hypothetical protein
MIPSAKSDRRERLPPENRLRNPRMLEPEKFWEAFLTVSTSIPGAGM